MSSINDLSAIVAPPVTASRSDSTGGWMNIHSAIGFTTPTDYREIVDTYGAGGFGNFLWVYQPQSDNKFLDLKTQISMQAGALRELKEIGDEIPHQISSLKACGVTDNGDVIYWVTEQSQDPDGWTIAVNAPRDDEWSEYDGSLLDFLVAVFSGAYVCPIFPDDFPGQGGSLFKPV
ncbi:hypothetical protein [Mycobacterium sp. D16R24]|uniref:hypothetical protein n=1 Tax=Mycobacterium sp. D16R24 TaxID=1855656 RepID=UPI000992A858|nr:hypothetical protein [Mycobacterium sp. D16R24]